MPRRKISVAALAPLVVALPLVAEALRAATTHAGTWFWGDQALIDLEARNSLIGRNLLGVYDRYGWHHLGPFWLALLGVFRWLGAGSAVGLVVGNDLVQAAAAAAIVVVAMRLRPGLTGWWAALVLLGYEWSFGAERLGTVWAPYAIALPAALLVLLVADIVSSRDPWPPTIGAAVCASFLCQTDISTAVVVGALVVVTPVLRLAAGARLRRGPAGGRGPEGRRGGDGRRRAAPADGRRGVARAVGGLWKFQPGWGWAAGRWRRSLVVLVVVVVVAWLPTIIQQFTTNPGNIVQVYRFLSKHPGHQSWGDALQAAGTIFGSFPLRLGEQVSRRDSDPGWLVARSVGQRPWFLAYLVVTAGAAVYGFVRRRRAAASLAAATTVAMLAAVWSVHLAYGPLYPYLVLWTGALVVPALTGWWLALAPPLACVATTEALATAKAPNTAKAPAGAKAPTTTKVPAGAKAPSTTKASAAAKASAVAKSSAVAKASATTTGAASVRGRTAGGPWVARMVGVRRPSGLVLPAVTLAAAFAMGGAFGATSDPMAGPPSHLARRSWEAVAAAALAPGVRTVYVDIVTADAMPEAAAIADQAVRHGLRVEVNRAALYFLDPSFAPTSVAQLKVIVCCGRNARGRPPAGAEFEAKVGGQRIYISTAGYRPVTGGPVVTQAASRGPQLLPNNEQWATGLTVSEHERTASRI